MDSLLHKFAILRHYHVIITYGDYPVLPILLSITNITKYFNPIFINIIQYYIYNIPQHYIGPMAVFCMSITQYYQYYSTLLIQYYSIFLTLKTVFSGSNSTCVNISQYYKPFPIFIDIINIPEQLGNGGIPKLQTLSKGSGSH